jgi:hypothetical protein
MAIKMYDCLKKREEERWIAISVNEEVSCYPIMTF